MEIIRVTENWQRAGVCYVRTEAMVKGYNCPLDGEFGKEDQPDTPYILALDAGFPIGTCRIHYLNDEIAKIERVSVLSDYRQRGVGKAVIEAAEDWIRENGIKKIIITSRDEAVGFYEALGYVVNWEKIEGRDTKADDRKPHFVTVYTEKTLN